MVKKIIEFMKKDEGSGLILALMTLMVLSVLGASLGTITIGSYKLADVNRENISAYYIAEAGANMAYEDMKNGVLAVHEENHSKSEFFIKVNDVKDNIVNLINSDDNYYKFEPQFGDTPSVKVNINVESDSNPKIFVIESTSELAGKSRTVNKTVEVTWTQETEVDSLPEIPVGAAVIVNGNIDFKPNGSVIDDVIVSNINNITRNGKIININDNKGKGNNKDSEDFIKGEVLTPIHNWNDYETLANSFPDKSKFGTELNSNRINVSESDNLFFYTDNLDLGNLIVSGDGIVSIYVKNNLYFNGDSFNLKNDFRNVRIFYAGNTMEISKQYEFNASLFVEKADISIQNKVIFNGVLLYGGDKEIKLGVKDDFLESYLIAPFAPVILRNHVNFKGTIIANSLNIDNHATVEYKKNGSFPFSFKGTGPGGDMSSDEIISSEPGIEN